MMIKEIERTANVAWSPASSPLPICLAAGTAAQQLDATFSTTSSLEIYELNVQQPGLEMDLKGSVATEHRFHKVAWGARSASDQDRSASSRGIVVGGCDAGQLFVYDASKIVDGVDDPLVFRGEKHSGSVRAIDFNAFQSNLMASGAGESEILVWDLNNLASPMTPGARSQPPDDVTCVAWNCQVQHILASTFGTRCVVWDLRKNEPIIKVSNSTTRMRCKVVAWHPNVATQLCLASEDDHTPFIQLWDLRFATSPMKTLENHQRGVLSLAWCPQDPDLLLSCGKDCRILVWNPNSGVVGGEVLCEIPTSNQWSFDVAWCPRNPAILSSSSYDGHVSIYSLMGGVQNVKPDAKITEAFMDIHGTTPSSFPEQQHRQQEQQVTDFVHQTPVFLTKPPKWCRRPVGASFGVRLSGRSLYILQFGGKLASFGGDASRHSAESCSSATANTSAFLVYVSQVVTEPAFVQRASQLEEVVNSGQFAEFCERKSQAAGSSEQQLVWNFLRAHFDADPKSKFLSLLGHDPADFLNPDIQLAPVESRSNFVANTSPSDDVFNGLVNTDSSEEGTPVTIPKSSDTAGLVTRMLLIGDLGGAIDECFRSNLIVEALLLANAAGQELLETTRKKYFQMKKDDGLTRVISAVVTQNWSRIVETCALDDWKEVMAGAMVYSKPDEFSLYCETLGRRLEADGRRVDEAILCHVCSANVAGLVNCRSPGTMDVTNPDELQNLVEQVTVLKRVAHNVQHSGGGGGNGQSRVKLSKMLQSYAAMMASQGRLATALLHLEPSEEESVALLQDRLSRAIGMQSSVKTGVAPQQRIEFDQNARPSNRPITFQQRQNPSFQGRTQQFEQQQQQQLPHAMSSSVTGYAVRPQRKEGIPLTPVYPVVPTQPTIPRIQSNARGPNFYAPSANTDPSVPYGQLGSYTNPGAIPLSADHYRPQSVGPPPSTSGGFVPSTGTVPSYNAIAQSSYGNMAPAPASAPAPAHAHPPLLYQPNSQQPLSYQPPLPPPPPTPENYGQSYAPADVPARTGWNDPPPQIIKPIQEQQQQQQEYERPTPITHPLFGSVPTVDQGWNMPQHQHQHQYQQQQQQQQQHQHQPHVYPVQAEQILTPNVSHQQAPQQLPPPPAPKTVPPEQQVLLDVFDALKIRCLEACNSMPMKRKLEDVSRKLEILYDKLRDNELSPNTTSGLHQIVQQVTQQRDYASALHVHAQIVATGAFAEIGAFMPALKYLLQAAQQLAIQV